jgi:predicted metal-dependent hydrolase
MADQGEIEIRVPKPGTEEQLKEVIEAKLKLISTELRKREEPVVVTLKKNRISES